MLLATKTYPLDAYTAVDRLDEIDGKLWLTCTCDNPSEEDCSEELSSEQACEWMTDPEGVPAILASGCKVLPFRSYRTLRII